MEEYSRAQEFHAAIASGYAFYTPGRDLEVKDIMTRADAYMYRHKRRNEAVGGIWLLFRDLIKQVRDAAGTASGRGGEVCI